MAQMRFVVALNNENIFQQYLLPSLQKLQTQLLMVKDDLNDKKTIFQKYNIAIQALIQTGLTDQDIVIFAHEDIKIMDSFFVPKIEMVLNERPNIGMIGIAGTNQLNDNCAWWSNPDPTKLRGHLIQEMENEPAQHRVWNVGCFDDIVSLDGCILIIRGKCLLEGVRFDESNYPGLIDFYDLDFSAQVLERGYKLAVADILIQHKSMGKGSMNEPWHIAKSLFINKWTNKGYKFPITADQFKVNEDTEISDNIVEIEI